MIVTPEMIAQETYDAAERALRVRSGVPEHHNGVAEVTPGAVTFSGKSRRVVLRNVQYGRSLLVSFNGGSNFMAVLSRELLDVDCAVDGLVLKGDGGSVAYECLAVI